jgi:RND family efflux transporter MFP subunit
MRGITDKKVRGHGHGVNAVFLLMICAFLITCGLLLLTGCKEKVKPGTAEMHRKAITGVKVTEIKVSEVNDYYETSGTVRAKTISVISSRVMGTVTALMVQEGDRVNAGQTLLTIDDRDMAERVKAAESALEAARLNKSLADTTYKRYKEIYDEQALTLQEMDQVETQKKVAEAEYERAKAMFSEAQVSHGFTRITAPIAGVVTEKRTDRGSMATPGTPLFTIENITSFRVDLHVDERLSGRLRVGMPVDIFIDSTGQQRRGRITELIPSIDSRSRTFTAKVDIGGTGLRNGLYARARIPVGTRHAIIIPKAALVEKGQLTGVYAVDEKGVATYRLVRIGNEYDNNLEVLSGIHQKDRIITEGLDKAVDGGVLQNVGAQ